MTYHFERALFVVGFPNAGKSSSLRSMFIDRRLGNNGIVPTSSSVQQTYFLSNERRLLLRLSSPHEAGETPLQFMTKISRKMADGRWNFAGALQPLPRNKMPDVVKAVELFVQHFAPERVRVVFLSPNQFNERFEDNVGGRDLSDELLAIDRVEIINIDGRRKHRNGTMLADFFDFT